MTESSATLDAAQETQRSDSGAAGVDGPLQAAAAGQLDAMQLAMQQHQQQQAMLVSAAGSLGSCHANIHHRQAP